MGLIKELFGSRAQLKLTLQQESLTRVQKAYLDLGEGECEDFGQERQQNDRPAVAVWDMQCVE